MKNKSPQSAPKKSSSPPLLSDLHQAIVLQKALSVGRYLIMMFLIVVLALVSHELLQTRVTAQVQKPSKKNSVPVVNLFPSKQPKPVDQAALDDSLRRLHLILECESLLFDLKARSHPGTPVAVNAEKLKEQIRELISTAQVNPPVEMGALKEKLKLANAEFNMVQIALEESKKNYEKLEKEKKTVDDKLETEMKKMAEINELGQDKEKLNSTLETKSKLLGKTEERLASAHRIDESHGTWVAVFHTTRGVDMTPLKNTMIDFFLAHNTAERPVVRISTTNDEGLYGGSLIKYNPDRINTYDTLDRWMGKIYPIENPEVVVNRLAREVKDAPIPYQLLLIVSHECPVPTEQKPENVDRILVCMIKKNGLQGSSADWEQYCKKQNGTLSVIEIPNINDKLLKNLTWSSQVRGWLERSMLKPVVDPQLPSSDTVQKGSN